MSIRDRFYTVIFGTDTPAGQRYDIILIGVILLSVGVVTLDSIESVRNRFGNVLWTLEWGFTILFTIEYVTRLWCHPKPIRFARSFYGLVDLVSFLPTYIAVLFPGASFLAVIRLLRVLRIFRVLRLLEFLSEANILLRSLAQSRRKIFVFMFTVFVAIVVFGSLMYIVEGPEYGFDSIPRSVYWAIVTVTTVGYGDITPHTTMGQVIAALAMLTGYAIIAVPTGIVSAEIFSEMHRDRDARVCSSCGYKGHNENAHYCLNCGEPLTDSPA